MLLVRYEQSTGAISGLWEATDPALLELQVVTDDPVYGYLFVDDAALSATEIQESWTVVGGELVEKSALTIRATPQAVPADGQTVCYVTVEPFVPCTLRINQTAVALTAEDPVAEVTASAPMPVEVQMVPMRTHWAAPITVEAR